MQHFHSNFYLQHPHISKIIKILKLFQVNTYMKIKTADSHTKTNQSKIR